MNYIHCATIARLPGNPSTPIPIPLLSVRLQKRMLMPAAPLPTGRLIFYTPPVLGGTALFDNLAPMVRKIQCPKDPEFYTPLVLNCGKGQHLPALEVYKNQSPTHPRKHPPSRYPSLFPPPQRGKPTLPSRFTHSVRGVSNRYPANAGKVSASATRVKRAYPMSLD